MSAMLDGVPVGGNLIVCHNETEVDAGNEVVRVPVSREIRGELFLQPDHPAYSTPIRDDGGALTEYTYVGPLLERGESRPACVRCIARRRLLRGDIGLLSLVGLGPPEYLDG